MQTAAFTSSLAQHKEERLKVVFAAGIAPAASAFAGRRSDLLSYANIRKWLLRMDSHHDNPLNRRACSVDTTEECET